MNADAGTGAGDATSSAPIDVRVVAGNPTAEDIAAVTAVLRAAADAAAARGRSVVSEDPRAAWEASTRAPSPLPAGARGGWSRSLR